MQHPTHLDEPQLTAAAASFDILRPDGGCLRVHTWGPRQRAAIVLVHGFGDTGYVWNPLVRSLGPRVASVAIDMRGHGDSHWSDSSAYRMSDYSSDLAAALRSLEISNAVLIGHSLGAEAVLRVAAAHTEVARAVVLVDGGPGLNESALAHMLEQFRAQPWVYPSMQHYLASLAARQPLADQSVLQDFGSNAVRATATGGVELKCDPAVGAMPLEDTGDELWHLLKEIRCPALLVRGSASAVLPRLTAMRIVSALSDASLVTVPLAGHAVMLDNPAGFNKAVHPLLARMRVL